MSIKSGIVSLLVATPAISAFVGSRVFHNMAAQGESLTLIVIDQDSADGKPSLDGNTDNLRFVDFDIRAVSLTSTQVTDLAEAIRVLLRDFTGTAGSETILATLLLGESDDYEEPETDNETGRFVMSTQYQFQYQPV